MKFTCPSCSNENNTKPVNPQDDEPEKDSVILCGDCGAILVVEVIQPLTLRVMREAEFLLLDEQTTKDVRFAVRNIKLLKERNASKSKFHGQN